MASDGGSSASGTPTSTARFRACSSPASPQPAGRRHGDDARRGRVLDRRLRRRRVLLRRRAFEGSFPACSNRASRSTGPSSASCPPGTGGATGSSPPTAACSRSATRASSAPSGSSPPPTPIVGVAPTPDNGGYWLLEADGTAHAFGDAPKCRGQCGVAGPRVTEQLHDGPGRPTGPAAASTRSTGPARSSPTETRPTSPTWPAPSTGTRATSWASPTRRAESARSWDCPPRAGSATAGARLSESRPERPRTVAGTAGGGRACPVARHRRRGRRR